MAVSGFLMGTMEQLDFQMPEFTRIMWVNDYARAVWEPRTRRISNAWMEIEYLAVAEGIRRCCITFCTPEDLLLKAPRWAGLGLNMLPVELQGVAHYSYQSRSSVYRPGQPFVYRLILGKPQDVITFKEAYDASDEKAIAQHLGYPPCCYEFFRRVWVDDGCVDTTWPMAVNTAAPVNGQQLLEVSGPPEANILWRWMGVRAVSHLPCRFNCPETVNLGKILLELGRRSGYDQEMDWLVEILRWPAEWSALHGIAEIKTPVLKVSTNTDATARKYIVQRAGDSYPLEGVHGLRFPYQVPDRLHLTDSRGFRKGLGNPLPVVEAPPPGDPAQNGFATRQAMDQAHVPIAELANAVLAGEGGNILDLGCGDGTLLQKIQRTNRDVVPFGIDAMPERIAGARRLMPSFADNFVVGSMFDDDSLWQGERHFALALMMPGRLLETTEEQGARLKGLLRDRCANVLVYAYGDWLTRFQNLEGLAQKAGISLRRTHANGLVALAAIP